MIPEVFLAGEPDFHCLIDTVGPFDIIAGSFEIGAHHDRVLMFGKTILVMLLITGFQMQSSIRFVVARVLFGDPPPKITVSLSGRPGSDWRQAVGRRVGSSAARRERSGCRHIHLERTMMPAAVLAPFWTTKERNQALQPFVPTADEIVGR